MGACKKIFIFTFSVICIVSCIKKKALKYDPDLVGTWVGTNISGRDTTQFWLVVDETGHGIYREYKNRNDDKIVSGAMKYSPFELRMWVGDTKFKVRVWLTKDMQGVYDAWARDYETLQLRHYSIDRRMVLKERLVNGADLVTFYRLAQ